jgi:hypothetical protein
MSEKRGNFFEEHIEKMVFAIIGIVSLWLLITRVLISPNYVEFDNKKFSPGKIDTYIVNEAESLKYKLEQLPEPKLAPKSRISDFLAKLDLAARSIDGNLYPPQPALLGDVVIHGKYRIPSMGQVDDVSAEHIRAVAYMPTGVVDEEHEYSKANSEPNDLDLVTVEGIFDVTGLYANFHESFAGKGVKEEWRDPCLAQPVFAAVELQRQDQFADGSWSDWQTVPRAEIDRNKNMLEVIEDVEQLPAGGIKVRMLQFNIAAVKADLLQPKSYQIASAEEEWYPPSLHKEYVKNQLNAQAQEKREAKEMEGKDRQKERDDAIAKRESGKTQKTTKSTGDTSGSSDMMRMMQMMGGGGGGMSTKPTSAASKKSSSLHGSDSAARKKAREDREKEKEKGRTAKSKDSSKSAKDIEGRFNDLSITDKTNMADMNEPLMFWAYDDTVRPGGTYKYRIRLGVFNPIAGTNQVSQEDESLNNAVVLWSDFSDETEPVEVPGIMYLFPLEIQEAARTVTIQVARYVLGYWYSKDFMVSPGEVIGSASKYTASKEEKDITVPKEINYLTNAVLVDARGPVKEWTGGKNLSERYYFDMLYSLDNLNIAHLAIKRTYWPLELQAKYDDIAKAEKEPKKPLREWGSKRDAGGGRPTGPTMPGGDDTDTQKMLQMMMGGGGGPGGK